jgi:hypothetical protein
MRWLVLFILPLLLASSAFAGDSHEDALRTRIARLPPLEKGFLSKSAYAGHYSLDRLVTFTTRDNRLVATFHLPRELVEQFRDPAPLLISLEGSDHIWSVHRRQSGTLDTGLSLTVLTCYAPDETWPFNRFSLSSDGLSCMVAAAQMYGHPNVQQNLSMSQGERSLHLFWRLQADQWKAQSADLASLNQLPTRAAGLMNDYLLPVLQRLGPARPASDVYRVFDQIPADPKVVAKIRPILAQLDANDSRQRDAAAVELISMGRQAVLACMRLDPAELSPEQQNRLTSMYRGEGWVHVADVEAARRDPVFLSSCLEDQDPAVRLAARNLLAAIRAVPGGR